VSTPLVRPNTLVRINPVRNAISDVIPVGLHPEATVVGGRSVWVYNHGRGTVMEIDAGRNAVRQKVRLSATPVPGHLTGPVLDADEAAAWIVGADRRGDGFLMRILARGGGKREYRLDVEPKAVALGEGAVWVLGHGSHGDQVLRLDPGTGKVGARTPFTASVQLSSLTVGLGAVWAVASSTAILYRIDPRSSKLTRQRDLGERAGRPVVRFGHLWVPVLGQETLILDPRTLDLVDFVCCSDRGFSAAGYGSTWLADVPAGEVVRFDGESKQVTATIPVVGSSFWGHPCLSSIAAGAGGVWVTVVPSVPDSSHSPPREGC
jgi:DNA-binding beta-propeller fold protein YncE